MNANLIKRAICLLLTVALLLTHVPATVFAAEDTEIAAETVVSTEPSETETPTEMPQPESTAAPTAAPTEPETQPPVAETEVPTETPQPEETAAPTEPATEPPVPETETPTEPPVEETTAPTEPPIPEETTAPTEVVELEEGIVEDEAMLATSGFCGENLTWSFDEVSGTLTITGTGPMTNYSAGTVPWNKIRGSVSSVQIGSGVTTIGDYAFYFCSSLTSVTIPGGVTTIGDRAFGSSSLTDVYITDANAWCKVNFVGSYSNPMNLADNLHILDAQGNEVTELVLDQSVTAIPDYAFRYCSSLTSVTIPSGVTAIGDYAFYNCTGLTSITIPGSVTTIGDRAFGSSSLTDVYITDANAWCKVNFVGSYSNPMNLADNLHILDAQGNEVTELVLDQSVTAIPDYAFRYCSSLTSVTIPSGVTAIGDYAFYNCTGLTSITIPSSVTTIGDSAFSNCSSLTDVYIEDIVAWLNISFESNRSNPLYAGHQDKKLYLKGSLLTDAVIPSGVTAIPDYAFYNCTGLTSVTIPAGVTTIGDSAFYNCSSLTDVYIEDIVAWLNITFENYGSNPLYAGHQDKKLYLKGSLLTDLVIPSGVTAIPDYAFYHCSSLTSVTIPAGVTTISTYAFYYCTGLTSLSIPASVTTIGDYAFYNCSSLTDVYIDDLAAWLNISFESNRSNPLYAGHQDKKLYLKGSLLTDLVIPSGVTTIPDYAFRYCSSLTSVTIPSGVTTIGTYAFYYCTGLTSLSIPASVTRIGSDAFSCCDNLTDVYIDDLAAWLNITFENYGSNPLRVGQGKKLYLKGSLLTDLVIPSGVTAIPDYAFRYCSSLKSVTIPNGVTGIGAYAFYGCSDLTGIYIPADVTTIGDSAFYNCSNLQHVFYGGTEAQWAEITIGSNNSSLINAKRHCGTDGLKLTKAERTACTKRELYRCDLCSELLYDKSFTGSHQYVDGVCTACGVEQAFTYTISDEQVTIKDYTGSAQNLVIPATIEGYPVTAIGDSAFGYCSSLKSVTIPSSVTTIGEEAFYYCTGLTGVSIPASVTTIGNSAFYYCKALTSIEIPDGVTTIPDYAFYNCTGLTSVTIPAGVTGIGAYAFYGCSDLTGIYIPADVTTIDTYAFYNCSNLQHVFYGGTEAQWAEITIGSNNTSLTKVKRHCDTDGLKLTKAERTACTKRELYRCDLCSELLYDKSFTGSHQYVDGVCTACSVEQAFTYTISDEQVTIKDYTGSAQNLVIPATIEGYPVTAIGNSAFSACSSLKSVTIPSSVTTIGEEAFYYCTGLTSVTIPSGVTTIGDKAFYNCADLTDIYIPASVITIGNSAFYNCSSLTDIYYGGDEAAWAVLGANVPTAQFLHHSCTDPETHWVATVVESTCTTGGYTCDICACNYERNKVDTTPAKGHSLVDHICTVCQFAETMVNGTCGTALTWNLDYAGKLTISGTGAMTDYTVPSSIPWYSYRTSIKSVVIEEGVTSICEDAFSSCSNLAGVSIPSSVTSIGEDAFHNCTGLTDVYISDPSAWCKISVDGFYSNPMYYGEYLHVLDKDGNEVTEVELDTSVTVIPDYAFKGSSLTGITIPDSVQSIGKSAFQSCKALTSVEIPASVLSIGAAAFYGCSGLTGITIPASVQSIGYSAFHSCKALTSIEIPDGVQIIENYTFSQCDALTSVTIPDSVQSIGEGAFYYCKALTSIEIPDSVQSIGKEAFYSCTGLTSITIGSGVTSIGDNAFNYCSELTDVYISDYSAWWKVAFAGSYSKPAAYGGNLHILDKDGNEVTELVLDNSVTEIPDSAFRYCSSLKSVTIPSGVTGIGAYAFYGCSALTGIYIPASVTTIGNYAFDYCRNLQHIFYGGTEEQWAKLRVSSNNTSLINVKQHCDTDGLKLTKAERTACTKRELYRCDLCSELLYDKSFAGSHQYVDGVCTVCGVEQAFVYTISNEQVTITDYTGSAQNLVIPATIEGYPVTAIGDSAFYQCTDLTSVVIPDGVTSIGEAAFRDCSNLTSITIPNGVTSIGASAFRNCSALVSVEIPGSVTSIGNVAFGYCTALASVEIQNCVTRIGDYAFYRCTGLTSITIPDSVTYIGEDAFYSCSGMTSVTIGSGVKSIGEDAFYYCEGLTDVYITDPIAWCKISFGSYSSNPVNYADCLHILDANGSEVTEVVLDDSVTEIPDYTFRNCTGLTSIEIPDSVQSIGASAFSGCSGLTSVKIPDSVTSIGFKAFISCSKLASVIIGNGVQSIDTSAFLNCAALTSVTLGSGVQSIGDCAFEDCTALTEIVIPANVKSVGQYAFRESGLTSLTIENGVESIGSHAFASCNSLTSVVIPDSMTTVEDNTFYDCDNLANVTIGNGIKTIGSYAFGFCGKLASVTIGSGVESIESGAFSSSYELKDLYITNPSGWCKIDFAGYYSNPANYADCLHILDANGNEVTEVVLDDSVTEIPDYAFRNCTSLTSIEIPDSVQSIGASAFYGCSGLTSVEIPDSVTSIGSYAFQNSTSLTDITIPDGVTAIGEYTFTGCTSLTGITIPDSVQSIGNSAFSDCTALTEIAIPDGVTTIGNSAFSGCSALTDVAIPNSVTIIGGYAFSSCTGLTSIVIPDSVTIIDVCAFENCANLTNVMIPVSVTTIGSYAFNWCARLKDVYYGGVPYQWSAIDIKEGNEVLSTAAIHYVISGTCGENLTWFLNEETGALVISGTGAMTSCPWSNYASSIKTVVIGRGVTTICNDAFAGCTNLTGVTIPDSVTSIGNSAFNSCRNLTDVAIPEGVTAIGWYTFGYCWNLTSVRIPRSVKTIGYAAFYRCTALTDVHYGGNAADWRAVTIDADNEGLELATIHYTARGTCGSNLTWTYEEGTGRLTISGTGPMTDFASQNYQPWRSMAANIRSVVIERGVTSIGNHALRGCTALERVTMADTVTDIGVFAFSGCTALTGINIPAGVSVLEDGAFANCGALRTVTLPSGLRSIGRETFYNCGSLTSINIPAGVTAIPEYAFHGCTGLTSIEIPGSVTDIGYWAFNNCTGLTSVTIGTGLKRVAEQAFINCGKLKTVYYFGSEAQWNAIEIGSGNTALTGATIHCVAGGTCGENVTWMYDANTKELTIFGTGAMADYDYFEGAGYTQPWKDVAADIKSVVIKNGVTSIGMNAFARCRNIVSVEIPESVTSIGDIAFFQCYVLKELNLPSGLQYIGDSAFRECMELKNLWIPASVTYIGDSALAAGFKTTGIWVDSANPAYCSDSSGTVFTKNMRTLIQVPGSRSGIYEVPDYVTTIGSSAFRYNDGLTKILIPNSVTVIEGGAFLFCNGVRNITLPSSVTTIESYTFASCWNLTSVVIPDSVTTIEWGNFDNAYMQLDLYYGGTVSQWEQLSEYVHENIYVHCGYMDYENHWRGVTNPATCTQSGSIHESCACGYERTRNSTEPAKGHNAVVIPAVAPTCAETGLTEGSRCERCGVILAAQEVIPALGHAYAEQNDTLICKICGHEVYIHIQQDYLAMDLQTFTWAQLDMELSRADLAESIVWSIEGDKDIVAVEDGLVYITGNGTGNAYVIATITVDNGLEKGTDGYETYTVSSRCRVEVAESIQLKGIQLSTDKVTTELFKTEYAAFEVLLQLPEYYPVTDTAMTVSRPAGMSLAGAGKQSNMIDAVAFTTQELNDLFELRMLDDRTVQLIPRYETAIEMALANSRSVKGTYKDTVKVTVQGTDYYSEMLTLTVKQTKPKLTGTVPAFNSFYTGQTQQITIKGATPKPDGFSPNEAKATAKTPAIPAWLKLQEDTLTLTPDAPLKNASGSAHLLVETEQWRVPAAVSVSVRNTYKAPALKLSATSVNMSADVNNSGGAQLKLLCTNKKDTLSALNVTGIEATGGFVVEEGSFNIADGSFILHAPEGFTAQTVTLKVYFNQEVTTNTLTLKLKVTPKVVTLKLSPTSITLNREARDSIRVKLTATPADHQIDPVFTLTTTQTVNGRKETVDKWESGELEIGFDKGEIVIKTTEDTPAKATYKLGISSGGSKPVTLTINVMSGEPSVTYKATGSMDLSFPNQTAVIKPTFKNYKGGIVSYDYTVTELKGKTVVNEDVKDAFYVEYDGASFSIRCREESAAQINTANTYQVRLNVTLNSGETIGNTINLKVKRTIVKLKLSSTRLTLNKLTGDSGSIAVTCTTRGYAFTEPLREVTDKYKQAAADQLDIGWENGRLIVKTVPETVYGMTYTVTLRGDAYGTPVKLTVTIPTELKSTVTATLKAKNAIDVVRDGTTILLTPTYKNILDRTGMEETLVFTKTANRVTSDATNLFEYTRNADGTFTVTKAEKAELDHSAKYTVKLVTTKNGKPLCETKAIPISVKAGSVKLTAKTDNTTLFAKDKNDRALVWFEATDATLNGVKEITIANTTQAKQFEIIPYGDGLFAIGFKDGKADSALTKRNINSVSIRLNVFVKGNETAKASTTATVKLTIVK